ncbi:ATP-binding protein [Actinoplanes sp. NPDC049681]|uniref:ATP-binding protein n=1 Tax=Actinoplanes sp. NPDC049681 TaxID=3363905 RepID=UPI003796161C
MADSPAPWPLLARDFDTGSLVALRREVEHCAQSNGLTDLELYRFVVAVNEITTNAVRHGGGRGRLELWRTTDRLHCRITDQGAGIPARYRPPRRPAADAVGGRGLWLARNGIPEFAIRTGTSGTEITLSSAATAP